MARAVVVECWTPEPENFSAAPSVHSPEGQLAEDLHPHCGAHEAAGADEPSVQESRDSGLLPFTLLFAVPLSATHPPLWLLVSLQTSEHTEDGGALQKASDFVRAFMLGFDVEVSSFVFLCSGLFVFVGC